jgi:hypothetical protein
MQRKALRDARKAARGDQRATRVLDEQERVMRHQARLHWAAAHDPQWLARADLLEVGRAWASAAAYADTDPAAASAMRKCEDRMRTLHPHAMARYDRLRADGMGPLDAMQETAPLFSRSPDVRVGDPAAARPALDAGAGDDVYPAAGQAPGEQEPDPAALDDDTAAELRGRRIVERLQSRARAAQRPGLGADELAMVLEAATNLPEDVIATVTRQAAGEGRGAAGRSAAELAAESFPHSAAEAVRAGARARTVPAAHPAVRVTVPGSAKRPGRSM